MIPHTPDPHRATLPRWRLLAAAGSALVLAGCTGGQPAEPVDGAADQVTALTSFQTFGRDAYWFVAADQGFFGDANLDVQVEPGFGAQNLEQLAGGTAQFAAIDMSSFAINMDDAENRGFTAIAAIHQLAPAALMTVNPDIRGPLDLAGRTVAMAGGSVLELLFPAYAAQVDLDPADVEIVDTDPGQLPAVLAGDAADAVEQFHMGLPTVQAAVGGREVTVLPYSEYLTDLYGVVIVTTTELAESDPDLVERFRDALLLGLAQSLDDPDQAGQILASVFEEQDPQVAAAELEIMNDYSRVSGTPLGGIDPVRVARSIALLEALGAIGPGMTADDLVTFDLVPQQDPAG